MNPKIVLAIVSGIGMVAQELIKIEIKKRQKAYIVETLTSMTDQLFAFNQTVLVDHPETKPNDRATEREFKNIISKY